MAWSDEVDKKELRRLLLCDEIIADLSKQLVCQETHRERNESVRSVLRMIYSLRDQLSVDYLPF